MAEGESPAVAMMISFCVDSLSCSCSSVHKKYWKTTGLCGCCCPCKCNVLCLKQLSFQLCLWFPLLAHWQALKEIKTPYTQGIEILQASGEADGVLAAFTHQGTINAVVSNDTDHVAYLTPCILFKMARDGSCQQLMCDDLIKAPIFSKLKLQQVLVLVPKIMIIHPHLYSCPDPSHMCARWL